jgi:hypothetical protein
VSTPTRPAAAVEVAVAHQGDRFVATVTPAAGAPQRLAAYWAVTEQGTSLRSRRARTKA